LIAHFASSEVPKEGITAGDIALQGGSRPEPTPAVPIQEPQAPQGPEMILADIYKRLDQQGTLLVQIADRIIAPQNAVQSTGSVPVSIMGIPLGDIKDIIGMVRQSLGASENPGGFMFDLYKQAHVNYDNKVLLPTFSKLAGIDARAATHVSG
jgi:hypothetical protein